MNDSELFDRLMEVSVGQKRQVNFRDKDGLRLFKYSRDAFFSRSWLDENRDLEFLIHARGIVFDIETKTVVCRPFFRLEEVDVESLADAGVHDVIAEYKVNGFMAAVWFYNGEWRVSTTGSLESDFVDMARTVLTENRVLEALGRLTGQKRMQSIDETYDDYTYLFEIVHDRDPHIISEQKTGRGHSAWLIGARVISEPVGLLCPESLDDIEYWLAANGATVFRPHFLRTTVDEILELSLSYRHEGYMILSPTGQPLAKFKTPFYKILKYLGRSKRLVDKDGNPHPIEHSAWTNHFTAPMFHLVEFLFQRGHVKMFVEMDEQQRIGFLTMAQREKDSYDASMAAFAESQLDEVESE